MSLADVETNLFGVFYACHHAIPMLKKRGGGYIINISSLAGQNAILRWPPTMRRNSGLTDLAKR